MMSRLLPMVAGRQARRGPQKRLAPGLAASRPAAGLWYWSMLSDAVRGRFRASIFLSVALHYRRPV